MQRPPTTAKIAKGITTTAGNETYGNVKIEADKNTMKCEKVFKKAVSFDVKKHKRTAKSF